MLYHLLMGEKESSEKIALYVGQKSYTYRLLHYFAKCFSEYLHDRQIAPGDRIIIITSANIDTVVAILGCIFYGAVFILIDARRDESERLWIVEETKAKLVIDSLPSGFGKNSRMCQGEVRRRMGDETQVYILYTSGSTCKPKGVLACVRQVMFCVEKINQRLQNCVNDKILCAVPISFDYGLYQIFLSLASGAKLYLEDGMILQRLPMLLQKEHITAFPVVPSMLNLLCHAKLLQRVELPYLRYICWTGDRLSLQIIEELHRTFPDVELLPMYGLTECKRVSIMPLNCYEKTRKGSCGLPLDGVQVSLQNVDENGVGELIVTGENVMERYEMNDGIDDIFSINPIIQQRVLKTGDLFFIDNDGFLYFCGRKRRIIKSSGFRIGNAQVEGILEKLKGVFEVRVEGVPDELLGERIGVAIFGDEKIFKRQYIEMKDSMSILLRPQIFYFSQTPLPKNENGKFDDREISKLLVERGNEWNGK